MEQSKTLAHEVVQRLSLYLNYLKTLPENGPANITAEKLGEAVDVAGCQVVSDLQNVGAENHPKIGYITEYLLADIERTLGYDNVDRAILVGVGHLGKAILSYPGFANYGLHILAAFDTDPAVIGTQVNNIPVHDVAEMAAVCGDLGVHIGIITAPAKFAQSIADQMVDCDIRGIWNFAPTHLKVPDTVLVENENIADSLVILSQRLADQIVTKELEQ
ncbi:MAG: redox-sensing transcriptional repressor Rex [Oscillospiraceae bacterium]|nr:redox-sensing transcriptional repressor Rex [Oscillospiraceae bacterium]